MTPDHELVRRVAAVLRAEVAPATEGARARSQAFRASAVLQRVARHLELAATHDAAATDDRRALAADLAVDPAVADAPALAAAVAALDGADRADGADGADGLEDHKRALARLVAAVHDERDRLPDGAFDRVLARVRRALRSDLDRDLDVAG